MGHSVWQKKKKFKTIIFTSLYLYIGNIQVNALFFGFDSNVFCVITSRWFFCSLAAQLYNHNWMVGHVSTQSELKFNHIRVFNRFFPPQFSSMNLNPSIYIQITDTHYTAPPCRDFTVLCSIFRYPFIDICRLNSFFWTHYCVCNHSKMSTKKLVSHIIVFLPSSTIFVHPKCLEDWNQVKCWS